MCFLSHDGKQYVNLTKERLRKAVVTSNNVQNIADDMQFKFPSMYTVKIIEAEMFVLVYLTDKYKSY